MAALETPQTHAMPPITTLPLDDQRWRDFVDQHPLSTPFHDPAWAQLVADCYGFDAFAAALIGDGGEIRAGAPMVAVRHLARRPRWVSLPFTDYCPPLAASPTEESALAEGLLAASREAGLARVELRGSLHGAGPAGPQALRHVLALDPDPAVVHAGFHPSQVQRNIRRAEREGLQVRRSVEPDDLLTTFYELHLRTRRRQGVPIQPRRFFRLIAERLLVAGSGWVDVVEAAGRPVAAALFMAGHGTVIYKFGASDDAAWKLRPNHLLFWHAIRVACEEGYATFDFGRTDANHDSLAAFKRSWGAREETLTYSVLGQEPTGDATHGTAGRVLGGVIRHSPPFVCRAAGELLYRFVA
jgi:CelD/BcsL family acetyltransferase involved in cellulose biosynthesis